MNSLFCLLSTCCSAPLWGSKALPVPNCEGVSDCAEFFLLHNSLPESQVPFWFLCLLYFLIYFTLSCYVEISLLCCKSGVFCQHPIGVLSELFHMKMYFHVFLNRKVISTSYSSSTFKVPVYINLQISSLYSTKYLLGFLLDLENWHLNSPLIHGKRFIQFVISYFPVISFFLLFHTETLHIFFFFF